MKASEKARQNRKNHKESNKLEKAGSKTSR